VTQRITSYARDGWVFDVRDTGPLDGDPVVLLHGFPERAASWDAVAAQLHEAGLRTLAPDQRGYSPRARPRTRWGYRATELVADVAALVDVVGRPVHLVGHDWGAFVAWELAAHRPELVRTLTAVSVPHPGAFVAAARHGDQLRRSWYFLPFSVPLLPEWLAGHRADRFDAGLRRGGMTEDDLARFHRDVLAYGALPGALGWYRAVPFTPPGWARRTVGVPTSYVWSDGDVALGRDAAERTADFCTGPYQLVVLQGVTHWIPAQAPDLLAEVVRARIASRG
jgi:pimeloyl-ACP methyl ester carboxylesterase